MKQKIFNIGISIALALTVASSGARASTPSAQLPNFQTFEAPRITQAVDNRKLFTVPETHPRFIDQRTSMGRVPDDSSINHLQLLLKPSAKRQAAMEAYIAQQHTPGSAYFRHWLTPREFGQAFGIVDADVAAVRSWLVAQGFTVNTVYPNTTLIDFSGTVGQVRQAFHTQESIYKIGRHEYVANAEDIAVPAALKNVVTGVLGLSDFGPEGPAGDGKTVRFGNARQTPAAGSISGEAHGERRPGSNAVPVPGYYGPVRALVPNDLMTMYGIRTIRGNGVVGTGVTIALVGESNADIDGWNNFVDVFNLARFGGSLEQLNPLPPSGPSNCQNPAYVSDEMATSAEWATAIAPGAQIEVATCSVSDSQNAFGGVFIAVSNLINGDNRPNIISATTILGESYVGAPDKAAMDMLWAQADAEGISVFVATGDAGVNAAVAGPNIYGAPTIDVNALATSAHVTAVGGTDLADVLDGTTREYFAATPSIVGGSALSYVPEIAWNESCGNGVAAKSLGFDRVIGFCNADRRGDVRYYPGYLGPEAGGGGPSYMVGKPAWQKLVYNAANDATRDVPDVALFAGSYGHNTVVMTCRLSFLCTTGGNDGYYVEGGTELSTAMFSGIQALMDQGLAERGFPLNQGNAAPTLYALAAAEYGAATGPIPSTLSVCNSDNGATGTDGCVFHNVTRGSISTPCTALLPGFPRTNCYIYYSEDDGVGNTNEMGLTTADTNPTHYGVDNKAYGAQPGWSFATGLGSVNAKNLLIAWRAFLHAPPATTRQH